MKRISAVILAASMLAAVVLPASQMSGANITIPTPGLNPEGLVVGPTGTQNLYVATNNSVTTQSVFVVINTQFNSITATLALFNLNTPLPHPPSLGATVIAENPAGTLVFIVNSVSHTVDVIDVATNTQFATFSFPTIGPIPAGARISPDGTQLWTPCLAVPPSFNNGTVNVTSIVDGTFGLPLALINTGGSPNEVVFNSKGSVAYVQNNGLFPAGFIDEVNTKTFLIIRNNIGAAHLNNPNPVSMDITKDNATLYVGNGESTINNLDIPTGSFDNDIFMFPGIGLGFQQIGQVLVSPDQKFVVSADTTLGRVSVARTGNQTFSHYIFLPPGSVPYFMGFSPNGQTLYVSNFNQAIFPVGGLHSITAITPAP
jgi:YVTN family beta-propeller protein